MSNMDEKIIALRNEYKKQQEKAKQEQGNDFSFKEYKLFDDKLQIFLPDNLRLLSQQEAEIKYPSQSRPPIIYTDPTGIINFTFNLTPQPLEDDQIVEMTHYAKQLTKRLNPANVFYKEELIKNEQIPIGYYDYKSYALDADVYNVSYVIALDHQMMLGTFNTQFVDYEIWRAVVLRILMTARDLSREEQEVENK